MTSFETVWVARGMFTLDLVAQGVPGEMASQDPATRGRRRVFHR
jgi:hypothetical protein